MTSRTVILDQLARVPTHVARADIEEAVARFVVSYAAGDVDGRIALCAATVHFEDPAGITLASDREQLRSFWTGMLERDFTLVIEPERLMVVGDEALLLADLTLRAGQREPARLFLGVHFVFDRAGLITGLRTFFDAGCVSS